MLPVAHDVIRSPGATRSGFRRPSAVGPFDEKKDTPYVYGASRCVDPTVIASAALPGSFISSARALSLRPVRAATSPKPELPAAVTTTTPDLTRRSTSQHSGLCPQANALAL